MFSVWWKQIISFLAFCVVFCRSLFVPLYFFFWPSCCMSFNLRILITPLVSSNSLWKLQSLAFQQWTFVRWFFSIRCGLFNVHHTFCNEFQCDNNFPILCFKDFFNEYCIYLTNVTFVIRDSSIQWVEEQG